MSLGNLKLNEIKHLFYSWFPRTISWEYFMWWWALWFSRMRHNVKCSLNFHQEFSLTYGIIQFGKHNGRFLLLLSRTKYSAVVGFCWFYFYIGLVHLLKFMSSNIKLPSTVFFLFFVGLNQYILFTRKISRYELYSFIIKNTQSICLFVNLFFILKCPGM